MGGGGGGGGGEGGVERFTLKCMSDFLFKAEFPPGPTSQEQGEDGGYI